jgi:hypothetical protein
MRKIHRRATAEGKTAKLDEVERCESNPRIEGTLVLRPDVWRRAAAKIGLAVGSIVYPAEWRLSFDAAKLREWIHNRDSSTRDGMPPPLIPTTPETAIPIARADEHLLFFMRMGDGTTYLVVVLFGTDHFAVPVDSTGLAVPAQAWRLDWRKPADVAATSWGALLGDAAMRYAQREGSS